MRKDSIKKFTLGVLLAFSGCSATPQQPQNNPPGNDWIPYNNSSHNDNYSPPSSQTSNKIAAGTYSGSIACQAWDILSNPPAPLESELEKISLKISPNGLPLGNNGELHIGDKEDCSHGDIECSSAVTRLEKYSDNEFNYLFFTAISDEFSPNGDESNTMEIELRQKVTDSTTLTYNQSYKISQFKFQGPSHKTEVRCEEAILVRDN